MLKTHPFAVDAFFEFSLVLTYAVEKELLAHLVPEGLMVDSYQNRWGFVAAAFVDTRKLRLAGLPPWMGTDFLLAGYRIFVRYNTPGGRKMRGLFILASETNSCLMRFLGNVFTNYQYRRTGLTSAKSSQKLIISDNKSGLMVEASSQSETVPLPQGSPFESWKEARRFAGPMPYTFNMEMDKVVIVEGIRENWNPRPVELLQHHVPFVSGLNVKARLASSFLVESVNYHWGKGVTQKLPA